MLFIITTLINYKTLISWGQGPCLFYSPLCTNILAWSQDLISICCMNKWIINECNILYLLDQILPVNHCSPGSLRSWQLWLHEIHWMILEARVLNLLATLVFFLGVCRYQFSQQAVTELYSVEELLEELGMVHWSRQTSLSSLRGSLLVG